MRQQPNITVFEHHMLVDVITTHKLGQDAQADNRCLGLYALDEATDTVHTFRAPHTIPSHRRAGRSTSTPPTPTPPRVTASPQPGARLPGDQHGVHPVSPDLPLPPASQVVSDFGGGTW